MSTPTRTTGFGAGGLGVTLLVSVFIGDAASETSDYWSQSVVIAATAISGILLAVGGWTLGSVYLGWWWPDTHEQRAKKRAERQHQEQLQRYVLRDAFNELLDEVHGNIQYLDNELYNGHVYGNFLPSSAWSKNKQLLDEHGQNVGDIFYDRLREIDRRKQERYDAASHEEINTPSWSRLTAAEKSEREAAVEELKELRALIAEAARQKGVVAE